jgi:hypothetical protein
MPMKDGASDSMQKALNAVDAQGIKIDRGVRQSTEQYHKEGASHYSGYTPSAAPLPLNTPIPPAKLPPSGFTR